MIFHWIFFLILGIFTSTLLRFEVAFANSCECAEISCSPCQRQTNIEFYTEKCGPQNSKVKSCKKPVCMDLDPLPSQCMAQAPKVETERKPAQVAAEPVAKKPVGTVLSSIGDVSVFREKLENPLKVGQSVFNEDIIMTSENGKAKIIFMDKSTISVLPKSKTLIQHNGKVENSKTLLDLMYGTIRSSVTHNEKNKIHFEVKTPSAVAGVRGTDFITTYYESSKITKVQTLEGAVELRAASGEHKVLVPAGHFASYVIDQDHNSDAKGSMKYVDSGFLTPLEKLTPLQTSEIIAKTTLSHDRVIAAQKSIEKVAICSSPSAKFNDCSWICKNNPKGAKSCRIDLKEVQCVRKRCDANGAWTDDMRLPASHAEKCESEPVVAPCDY